MTLTIVERAAPPVHAELAAGARLVGAGDRLWRVLDRSGRVIGHLREDDDGAFRALRYHAGTRTFQPVGRFWTAAEATECLRLSR